MFGPVSGGHFNPVVSLVDAHFGGLSLARRARLHPRPGSRLRHRRDHRQRDVRADRGQHLRPTTGPRPAPVRRGHRHPRTLLVIFSLARTGRATSAPAAVGAYIGAAYWFTSSTSFANPAITVGPDVLRHVCRHRPGLGPRLHRCAASRRPVPRSRSSGRSTPTSPPPRQPTSCYRTTARPRPPAVTPKRPDRQQPATAAADRVRHVAAPRRRAGWAMRAEPSRHARGSLMDVRLISRT